MLNYFEFMGLPTAFNIDEAQLQQQFRKLQTQYHPDQYPLDRATSTSDQMLLLLKPEQLSAVINEAYQTLLSPDTRAKHLLALQHLSFAPTDSIRDLAFLNDAMNFRMALEDADLTSLPALQAQITDWLNQAAEDFENAYTIIVKASKASDCSPDTTSSVAQAVIDATQKLQFLVKLQRDVAKKQDELAALDQNDDDLYV